MLRFATLSLALLLAGSLFAAPQPIDQELVGVLADADDQELLPVVILVSPRHDVKEIRDYLDGVPLADRSDIMMTELRQRCEAYQDALLDELYAAEQKGQAEDIQPLILANAISLNALPAVIEQVAMSPDVYTILYAPYTNALEPVETPGSGENVTELDEITWSVNMVNAPAVWDMGFSGEGAIVGVIDTGVNYNHLDIADHMWDGGVDYPLHGYDFYHNDTNPMDYHGHGTHVAGIAASDGTAGTECGVAPDATVMILKIYSDGGSTNIPLVWEALDFAVEHGADVATLSSGWYNQSDSYRQTFRDTYELCSIAGVAGTKSAGNSGGSTWNQIPEQVSTPGRVPPPWRNPDQEDNGGFSGLMAIGSTDINDNISDFSSNGPVTWESISPWFDYVYNNGVEQGLIKPDVSAPGEDILSLSYTGTNGYTTMSGTSMAAPNAAGVICLLRSINPNLTTEQIDEILETTAVDYGAPGKDNVFGAGRIDAYEAALIAQSTMSALYVQVDPLYDPWVLPGAGGTMEFDVQVNVYIDNPAQGQIWTDVLLPNGNTYHLDTYNINFQPDMVIDVDGATQVVPGWAPDGIYQFIVRAGLYPNVIISEDQFEFRKFDWSPDATGDWMSGGWDKLAENVEVAGSSAEALPSSYSMSEAYPNPFNPSTSLTISLPEVSELSVTVFNVTGQQVASLATGSYSAGEHTFTFEASDLASGLYFVQAHVPGKLNEMRKVTLMK